MSTTVNWRRRVARHLVEHAEKVLSPIRPTWAGVLKSELDHVPEDRRALRWAMGCVWASYMERYFVRSRPMWVAVGVGIILAVLSSALLGRIGAIPWPHWYAAFARGHVHLGLELWAVVAMTLPVALLAAGCGVLLGAMARRSPSGVLPWLSLAVWQFLMLAGDIYFSPATCRVSLRILWEWLARSPTSSLLGFAIPAAALIFAFRVPRRFAPVE